jgi:hypothetical protein
VLVNRKRTLLHARFEQVTVALLGHPVSAREMAVIDALRALGLFAWIDSKYDRDNFTPIGAFGFGGSSWNAVTGISQGSEQVRRGG